MGLSHTISNIKGNICEIFPSHVFYSPTEGFHWNVVMVLGLKKLEWCPYQTVKKVWWNLDSFRHSSGWYWMHGQIGHNNIHTAHALHADAYNYSQLLPKLCLKLEWQVSSGLTGFCVNCCSSFAPFWQVMKTFAEKLSNLHQQLMSSWQELVRDVHKYSTEQQKKHREVSCCYMWESADSQPSLKFTVKFIC